ncbi:MAG: hypothetical protein PVI90_11360 [Desulfobacteraceae bacterium]|jgi:radical SAM protein with 4Fe4S-binding SPASM domain
MHYIVHTSFENFERLKGSFIVYGNDYSTLMRRQKRFGNRIIGLIYTGPIQIVDQLPVCQLIINLDTTVEPELKVVLHKLQPERVSFTISKSQNTLPKIIELSPFPFQFDLSLILEHLDQETLTEIMEHYLREPANQLIVQPFHAILDALLHKKTINLWDVLWADPQRYRQIDGTKVVIPLGNDSFKYIGEYRDHKFEWTSEGKQLQKRRLHSFVEDDTCQQCPFFFICGGCIRTIYGSCNNWSYVLDQLQKTIRQINSYFLQKKMDVK